MGYRSVALAAAVLLASARVEATKPSAAPNGPARPPPQVSTGSRVLSRAQPRLRLGLLTHPEDKMMAAAVVVLGLALAGSLANLDRNRHPSVTPIVHQEAGQARPASPSPHALTVHPRGGAP